MVCSMSKEREVVQVRAQVLSSNGATDIVAFQPPAFGAASSTSVRKEGLNVLKSVKRSRGPPRVRWDLSRKCEPYKGKSAESQAASQAPQGRGEGHDKKESQDVGDNGITGFKRLQDLVAAMEQRGAS